MTQLKTLKEIEFDSAHIDAGYGDGCSFFPENIKTELRKEAIKWIKEKFTWKFTCDDTDDYDLFETEMKKSQKEAFMQFFNISEEDLK